MIERNSFFFTFEGYVEPLIQNYLVIQEWMSILPVFCRTSNPRCNYGDISYNRP